MVTGRLLTERHRASAPIFFMDFLGVFKHLFDKKNVRKPLLFPYNSTMPHSDLGLENRAAPFNHQKELNSKESKRPALPPKKTLLN